MLDCDRINLFQKDYAVIERMAARGELTPLQRRDLLEQARDLAGFPGVQVRNELHGWSGKEWVKTPKDRASDNAKRRARRARGQS